MPDEFAELREAVAKLPAEVWKDAGPDNYGDGWFHRIENQSGDTIGEFTCDFPDENNHKPNDRRCQDAKARLTFCVAACQHVTALLAAYDRVMRRTTLESFDRHRRVAQGLAVTFDNHDYRLGYSRGYNAGAKWPAHRPPLPPDPIVAKIIHSAKELRNAVSGEIAKFDEEDEIVLALSKYVDEFDQAMMELTKWIKESP